MSNQWSLLWAASNGMNRFARDPQWSPDEKWIKDNFGHLPTRFWDGVQNSLSEAHARHMVEQADKAHNIEQRLGSLGWGGVAANLAAAIIDPTAIALAIGSDGVLAPWLVARKVGTVGRILAFGASAGTQNAGLEMLLQSEKPGGDARDILYAALGGMVLGSAFAARPGHLLRDQFEALSAAADRARRTVEANMDAAPAPIVTGSRRAAGAGAGVTLDPLNMNASDALQWARENPAAPPAFAKGRFDAVAQTLSSKHPLAAKTMDGLGEDAVGRVGHAENTLAATEYQTWYHRLNMNEFYRVANSAWQEFADGQGLRWIHFRERARAYEEFHGSITRRIRQGVDAENVSPQADKVAKFLQDRFEKMLGDLKEPGKANGVVLPPVKGWENVSFNRAYVPRIWHGGKISAARARYGDDRMSAYFAQAYLARNPHLIAGGELQFVEGTKLVNLFGKTFWKRLRQHRAGVTDDLNRALSGEDLEGLKAQLYEAVDDEVSKLDIDKIVDGLKVADSGGMARAQQRAMLDENFKARLADKDGNLVELRVDDLLENSAERLFQMYSRNISGALAMARLGYPSLRDFERRLAHIRASAEEVKGYDTDALERDIRNLEYVATYVTGSPVGGFGRTLFDARSSRLGEYSRVVRDLNFLRLMGQLGFAQAAETFSIMGHMGIRTAFASMPSLRSLWRDARTGRLNDDLANELEVWVGLGTDRMRNSPEFRHEDFGDYLDPHHGERMAWVQGALNRGKVGLGEMSGANMVNTVLHRWAMRSIAQKFSDLADNPAAWTPQRLAAYGLDPDSQVAKDIFAAIKAHRTMVPSAVGSKKLAQFNLDKWPEDVAENFSLVMHRIARHVIQENDPGNIHAYMSHPASQLLFQFRHFMLVAHSKQLLHGIHMRDASTATTFLGTMVSAGLAYILQTYAQSAGQRDRQKFLQERLSPQRIGAASFSRAGWSAFLPWLCDNAAAGAGFPVPFGTRYSGLQPTGFLQNPTFDFANALYRIPFDGARAALHRDFDYSQKDFRRFHSVIPFQNITGVTQALQLLGSNWFPEESRVP